MVFIREETEKSPAHGWWCGRAAGGHMADQLVANLLFPLPCEKYIDLLGDLTIILYIILSIIGCSSAVCIYMFGLSLFEFYGSC